MKWKRTVAVLGVACLLSMFAAGAGEASLLEQFSTQQDSVSSIIDLLEQGRTEAALWLLDSLHESTIALRANLQGLSFEGASDTLSDPFELPEGTYRVHLTTTMFAIVKLFDMQGDQVKTLFNVAMDTATRGVSTLFRSTGGRFMLEVSNTSAPYVVLFERLS